jgi:hypothetical protein
MRPSPLRCRITDGETTVVQKLNQGTLRRRGVIPARLRHSGRGGGVLSCLAGRQGLLTFFDKFTTKPKAWKKSKSENNRKE